MTGIRNYTAIMLEEIREQNRAILEAVGDMQQQVTYIPRIKEDIVALKEADKLFKLAIKDISRIIDSHEQRITKLETM